jgi:hypothetical protein
MKYLILLALVGCDDDFTLHTDGGPKELAKFDADAVGDDADVGDDAADDAAVDVADASPADAAFDSAPPVDAGMCIPKYQPDAASVPWCKDNTNKSLGACCPGSSCACQYQPTQWWWCC